MQTNNPVDPDHQVDIDFITTLLGIYIHRLHKIFFLQFTLKVPTYPLRTPHLVFARFLETYFQRMTKMKLDPFIIWCREKKAGCLVYHCGLFLNGGRTSRSRHHLLAAETHWAGALGIADARGLVGFCTTEHNSEPRQNGIMIKTNPDDNFWAVRTYRQWLLYIDTAPRPKWKLPRRDAQACGFALIDLSFGKVIAWSSAWRAELPESSIQEALGLCANHTNTVRSTSFVTCLPPPV